MNLVSPLLVTLWKPSDTYDFLIPKECSGLMRYALIKLMMRKKG